MEIRTQRAADGGRDAVKAGRMAVSAWDGVGIVVEECGRRGRRSERRKIATRYCIVATYDV
jgi:hypothetical protein